MDCGVSRDACEDVVSVREEGRGVVFGTGYRRGRSISSRQGYGA